MKLGLRTVTTTGMAVLMMCSMGAALAGTVQITEWMYKGNYNDKGKGEFIEFTNISKSPVSMAGWSYSDSNDTAGDVDLSAFGDLKMGESVILTEIDATDFRNIWGLAETIKIIGNNTKGLGNGDAINLYDAMGDKVCGFTYGTTPSTNTVSCTLPYAELNVTEANTGWAVASVGDSFGSWRSSKGEIGNPGTYYATPPVPEPASILALVCGIVPLAWSKRRSIKK